MATKSSQQNATQEQILALLDELNNKLLPRPASKLERAKLGQVEYLAPFYDLRESMKKKMEAIFADAKELEREVKKAVRAYSPCKSEAAWEAVFKRSIYQLDGMVTVLGWHTGSIERQAFHLCQLVVMAAGDDTEAALKQENAGADHE